MSGDFARVESIFHAALELSEARRAEWLAEACGSDAGLRASVESLLRAERASTDGFLRCAGDAGEDGEGAAESLPDAVGPYRPQRILGHGAQATVFLARGDAPRRDVALKVLHRPLAGSDRLARRFWREAELTASFEHPGICSIYETGVSDGLPWIAMQYVPGSTLAALLVRDPLDGPVRLPSEVDDGARLDAAAVVDRILAFFESAARTLHDAHERGLVHRDVKPANLMVTECGEPILLDFGIARGEGDCEQHSLLTRSSDVLGTPHYMAPEQLVAGTTGVDRRVDVHALGASLFECLTRQRPFDAPTLDGVYNQVLHHEAAQLRSLAPRLPRDLEIVVQTALQKQPEHRYRTALDLAEDLRRVRRNEPIRALPPPPWTRMIRWARRSPKLAASLLVTLLSLSAGLLVSLHALGLAEESLDRELATRAAWYDELSLQVAGDDVHGRPLRSLPELYERSLAILEDEVPGFTARIEAIDGRRRSAEQDIWLELLRKGEVVLGSLDGLSPSARLCASDWLHYVARGLTFGYGLAAEPEYTAVALRAAQAALQVLDQLPAEDLRRLRARMLLLDLLLEAGRPREAEALVARWRVEPLAHRIALGALRGALYDTRLGAALLREGRHEQARPLLESSVPTVLSEYPESWLGHEARAYLLELYDLSGERENANTLRAELYPVAADFVQMLTRMRLVQVSRHVVRVGLGGADAPAWRWADGVLRRIEREQGPEEVQRMLDELAEIRAREGFHSGHPALCILYPVVILLGDAQGHFHGARSEVIRRSLAAGADLLEHSPPHRSDAAVLSRSFVGTLQGFSSEGGQAGERGLSLLEEAVALAAPGSLTQAQARVFLAMPLALRGEHERAEDLLLNSIEAHRSWFGADDVNLHRVFDELAGLYRRADRLDLVEYWQRRQLEIEETAGRRVGLARTLSALGREQEAVRELDRALVLRPDHSAAVELRAALVDRR